MTADRTALLVIDVQNDFCHPEGWAGQSGLDVSGVAAMLPRLARLIEAARSAGVPVVFVQLIGDEATDSVVWRGADNERGAICRKGTWGAQFMQVAPRSGEPVITKSRYGAFYKTELEAILHDWGVETIVFTGVSTNVCVESSVREAFMRDYHVVVAGDCVTAYRQASHDAALENVARSFGRVVSSQNLIAGWAPASATV